MRKKKREEEEQCRGLKFKRKGWNERREGGEGIKEDRDDRGG